MRVAVIGAGIAGLSAAWRLQAEGYHVEIVEKNNRLGGHTHTHHLSVEGKSVAVDTGFIVFNAFNYPAFCAWLNELQVAAKPSNMSFAVRDEVASLEYGTSDFKAITAHRRQLLRPSFWRMWIDLSRFYRVLKEGAIEDVTLGDYLVDRGYGSAFIDSHIAPMCAALWSQPVDASLRLSLRHVVSFMRNHRMLQVSGRPDWRVVEGGSSAYLEAFRARFTGKIHLGAGPVSVRRETGGVRLSDRPGDHFDAVVLACHADQALAVLEDPSEDEKRVLGAMPFQNNKVYLHQDVSFMPRDHRCWSSWNVTRDSSGEFTITYWMNRLQNLACQAQFFVTLNPNREPQDVCWQGDYSHPHFTRESIFAQTCRSDIGTRQTQFAGAYWGSGFHEDGFTSGLTAAQALIEGRAGGA